MELVHAIEHDHVLFTNLSSECRHLMQELETVKVKHNYREQNQVADTLAKEGRNHPHYGAPHILLVAPLYATTVIEADSRGTTFIRKSRTHT